MSCSLSLVYSLIKFISAHFETEIIIKILLLFLGWQRLEENDKKLCNLIKKATIFMPSDRSFDGTKWLENLTYRGYEHTMVEKEMKIYDRNLYKLNNINSLNCEISGSTVFVARNSNFNDGLILFHENQVTFFSVLIEPLKIYSLDLPFEEVIRRFNYATEESK